MRASNWIQQADQAMIRAAARARAVAASTHTPIHIMKDGKIVEIIPILEELWQTKDDLAREAGDDVARICENTRRWAAAHPHSGPVVKDAAELRAWLDRQEEPELSVVPEEDADRGGGLQPPSQLH
jgi:hypothetical protein